MQISASKKPLNSILTELRDSLNLNISFNDQELAKFNISINQYFNSLEEAFTYLLKDIPITYEKSGNVYLFYPKKSAKASRIIHKLSGKVQDANNHESLPYTHLVINNVGCITDAQGNFNFQSDSDSLFHLSISHLGYHFLDTTLPKGFNKKINLYSTHVNLSEIVVSASPTEYAEQIGSKAGLMRINHKLALVVPGNGENSIFNLLRLQPGIMASGEQSSEMIIWGSYTGQSQVNFDGITLFGLKNYNDNISAVNPYVAKDIRIHKGGFDATLGERVGGIIDISGINGNKQKPAFNLNINNMTMNVLAETPLGNKMSLVGAYRQTFYNLYSPDDITPNKTTPNHFERNSIVVNPDYLFRDGNLKLSGETEKGNSYHLSSFMGSDNFSYTTEESHGNSIISQEYIEKNQQYGLSANYNKVLQGKGNITLNVAYSALKNEFSDKQNSSQSMMNHTMHNQDEQTQNNISEMKTTLSGKLRLNKNHEIEFGGGLIRNTTFLKESNLNNTLLNKDDFGSQFMSFFQNRYSPKQNIDITAGFRTDYTINLEKMYFQPRINLTYKPSSKIQFNSAWGIYNQFLVLNSTVDTYNNYRYLWMISDDKEVPVISSQHFILGGVFHQKGFSISVEGFYKETKDISRVIQINNISTYYKGQSKTKGIDFFIKQEYKGHSAWISYSLAQTLEWFPYFESNDYKSSLHDQRHEIKLSGILNLSPFLISANYVFGSGFLQNTTVTNSTNYPYKRADIAGIYKLPLTKIKIETGLSILNVFNYKNIKYSNITQIPSNENNTVSIYAEAVPFTPSIFLNISF